MQYIEQQLAEFKAEFARRRKRQMLGVLPVLALFVLSVVLRENREATLAGVSADVLLGSAAVLVLGFVAFTLWNWRCPACNRYLGKGISPAFCSKCGVPLQ